MNKTETQQVRDALQLSNTPLAEDRQKVIAAIALLDADLARVVEPVAHLRFWAAQRVMQDGTVDADEGLEVCRVQDIGDDKQPAFPVYTTQQEAAAPEWMPIETAPKDGTRYLAYALHYGQFVENHPPAHYAGDWIFDFDCRHQWRGHAHCDDREATHWKPLGGNP